MFILTSGWEKCDLADFDCGLIPVPDVQVFLKLLVSGDSGVCEKQNKTNKRKRAGSSLADGKRLVKQEKSVENSQTDELTNGI